MIIYFNDINNITKKYNLNSFFLKTPTTTNIIEKVVRVHNLDNEKVKIYSSSLLHFLNDKRRSQTYIFISCLLHFFNI